ncbi:MAG: hypothetical protein HXS41_01225 [Theionarchaea archaeon]|nr:hypothetical protein [Theionarchaea archaeon]MBU6999226.1 hypothetical protein [Theionarchaea archaeon]MBU7019649.1 hypothetical protein [Theionarchaea archaeon]MBU7034570.1 hypothetical protein [Theionarchaea archaeon]MBU7040970.1 hypothetical protein [Theionarchaea archaeon]
MVESLLSLNLKEEWRMLTSYFSSRNLFFAFPAVLVVIGVLMGRLLPLFREAFEMSELVVAFHLLMAVYGLFVGAFGFFADEVANTWFKDGHLLIHMHTILPISFRKLLAWFYIKDIVYYLFLTIIPLFLGLFLSFSVSLGVFARLFGSSLLSFLVGVSVSFLVSSLYVRSRLSLAGILVAGALIAGTGAIEEFPPLVSFVSRDWGAALLSAGIFIVLSALSLVITKPVQRARRKSFAKTDLFHQMNPVLAKEIIDVRRSGTWQIIATSYLFPLVFMYGIFYFSGRLFQFHIDIPLVFYAGFIGYLSTLVYSWLNNIDPPSSFSTFPITASTVIKKKITLFLLFSFSVATVYLVVLGYILDALSLVPLSLVIMSSTSFYVAAVTAWLCGLYPNTRLFDGAVLARYLVLILPVLLVMSILSLMGRSLWLLAISGVTLVAAVLLYERLDMKYENDPLG